ncbi:MAG TPA: hypothetical protein VLN59_12620 [Burkholderiales bacterium]|nr:hypothetical protein [Burkholderiales bacterium]
MIVKSNALHPLVGWDVDAVTNVLAVVFRAEYLRDGGSSVVADETQEMQFLLTAESATELRDALDAALKTIMAPVPRSKQH